MDTDEIHITNDEGFQPVKRRKRNEDVEQIFTRRTNENPPAGPNEHLRNRFAALSEVHEIDVSTSTTHNLRPKLPPPIVIHENVKDHKKFQLFITKHAGTQYHLKYSAKRVTIQTYDTPIYQKLLNILLTEDIQCHTYTPYNEKTNGYVIKGLDCSPTIDEIKEDLKTKHKIA